MIAILKLASHFKWVFIIGCLLSFVTEAQVNFSLINNEVTWKNSKGSDYSPFDKNGYYSKATLEINVPANQSGSYFLSFENNLNASYREMKHEFYSDKLVFYVSKSTNSNQYLTSWPNISNDDQTVIINLDNSINPIIRVPIYIWIDPGQTVRHGNYSVTIPIKVFSGQYSSEIPTEVKRLNLKINAIVSDEIQVSIGNDSFSSISAFNIDFETLTEGETMLYKVYVKSVDNYTLKLYSENKSRLVNQNENIRTIIPYKVFLDNKEVQFFDSRLVEFPIEKTSLKEVSEHQIKVILGNPSHAFKGAYSDKLSVRASKQ